MSEAFQNRSANVVVLGAFAPAMFHPLWFQRYDLLGEQEAKAAADPGSLLMTDELTVFKVAGFDLDIRSERLQMATTQENLFSPLRDLVASTLNVLDAAPVKALGMNWACHFGTGSLDAWHAAGHKMIPTQFWTAIWPKHVGMQHVSVQLTRNDDFKGYLQVTVQPSRVVQHGVFVSINDHYDLSGEVGNVFSSEAATLLEKQWSISEHTALGIFEGVRKECVGA